MFIINYSNKSKVVPISGITDWLKKEGHRENLSTPGIRIQRARPAILFFCKPGFNLRIERKCFVPLQPKDTGNR